MVAVAAMGLLLGGCSLGVPKSSELTSDNGVSSLSATEILQQANAELAAAGTFRLSGTFQEDGVTVDFDLRQSGKNSLGSMRFLGMEVRRLRYDDREYFRFNEDYLATMIGSAKAHGYASTLAESWFTLPDSYDYFKTYALAFRFDVDYVLRPGATVAKGTQETIDQHPAIALTGIGRDAGTLYVATDGSPRPLKLIDPSGGELVFGDFGVAFPEVKAPPHGEILALPALS